ncbi:MAG: hypothetical protein FK730_09695 [Asgard group archaeon]|nr:hypothetical protein [Asgard group archaeon]
MTLHRKKIQLSIFNRNSFTNIISNFPIRKTTNYHNQLKNFIEKIRSKKQDLSNRTLVIVPGYSVSNPPKIGDHHYYINTLKFHEELNPYGYKRIFVFDIYSKKDGRCNFKFSIPQLAQELFNSINTNRDNWEFVINGEIDFIGGSMGGLIVRKFIQTFVLRDNIIKTKKWGNLQICNVVLIATPNHGCRIVDRLQAPFIQFSLRLLFGKNNFSKSEQFQQIAKGNVNIYGKFFRKIKSKFTGKNTFIDDLNSIKISSNSIRWITIRGTKWKWYSSLLYDKNEENDGVVKSSSVILDGAENIADKDLQMNLSWDHRDLYQADSVCKLLFGLLTLNLKLNDYLALNQLLETQDLLIYNQWSLDYIFNKVILNKRLVTN